MRSATRCAPSAPQYSPRSRAARATRIAVVAHTADGQPVSPCGACRQVLHEFGPEARLRIVLAATSSDVVRVCSSGDLLSDAFRLRDSARKRPRRKIGIEGHQRKPRRMQKQHHHRGEAKRGAPQGRIEADREREAGHHERRAQVRKRIDGEVLHVAERQRISIGV